jgi:tetratricopeptide (TPR) repeat protein
MKDPLKKFTEDLAKELKTKLQSADYVDFIDKVKASGDDRTFEVVMSTADEDRQGDSLDQANWDLKYFDMNPVVLWAHNYQGFPIGIVTDIVIQGDKAVATGKFAPEGVNPEADMACALYQQKILRAVSPGYIQNDDGTRELLELSFCPVPAGKFALSLRQVRALGVSTRELITKGFFVDEKAIEVTKADQVGDSCEQDDGTPGILAEGDSPGVLICVPIEDKEEKATEGTMKKELITQFKAEHGRHGEAVAKAIDDLSAKDKSIDEFEKSIEGEQADHLDKCMKAIDENADKEKSIDEFKKSITGEHLAHVKNLDKAIDEYKSASEDADDEDQQKAIDTFTKSAGDELDRHQTASMDLCKAEMGDGESDEEKAAKAKGQVAEELAEDDVQKAKYQKLNDVYDIFYAFTSAYMDDSVGVDDFEKLLDEAVALMKGGKEKSFVADFIGKTGAAISAKNKEKITAVIKSLESHNEEHGNSTTTAIASLKELTGSPQDDDGEEQKRIVAAAPKPRSSPPVATESKSDDSLTEFEAYMLSRKLLKAVYQASGDGLAKIKRTLQEKYPDRR